MNETFHSTFRKGLFNGLAIIYSLAKVIIPFYTMMGFVRKTGPINYIRKLFKPFMGMFEPSRRHRHRPYSRLFQSAEGYAPIPGKGQAPGHQ
jgi:hypothetical protein